VAGVLRCDAGHAFDVARQGYVNLAGPGRQPRGDTAEMVAARDAFLAAGHFDPLAAAVADAAAALVLTAGPVGGIVDVGAGTGWWLAHVLDRLPERAGLALDSSKPALRRAARAHPRAAAALCDAWRALPVADGAAALLLSVFAPRDGAEIARVLAPGGALLVVSPTSRHLAELVGPLGLLRVDPRKEDRLARALGDGLVAGERREVEATMALSRADAAAAAGMGPSAHHVSAEELAERVAALPETVAVTASVVLSVHRRGAS
jgi:23S rRNA (guanine745-N1)-methyltransferase